MEFKDMGLSGEIRKLNRHDLIIFSIPVIIFSLYLCVFNPGIATFDSFNQLHQIASGQFANWHPFFHTFINMLCLRAYPSPVSICILQILVFSTMWMAVCKYCRDEASQKTFKLQAIFSAIICLIPINGLYSITLWKDVLFSYLLMFLCFLAYVMVDRKGNVSYRFVILISIVMACISQLRGNGMYVIPIALVIYCVYLVMKRNVRKAAILAVLSVTFILLISSLNIAYDVADNEKDAGMVKTAHMLADYDLHLDIEDADRQKIHEAIDKDKIAENYFPTGSDKIFAICNHKELEAHKSTYIGLAIKYSLKYRPHFLEYMFSSSPMVWNIIKDSDWIGRPYYLNGERDRLQMDFENYYGRYNLTPTEPYENISYANWGNPVFNIFNLAAMGVEGCILDTFLNSPATYMYLSIILLIFMHSATGSREIYLTYAANLLNIITVFLSTPIQDYRYLYANLLVFYVLVIIVIGMRHKKGEVSE